MNPVIINNKNVYGFESEKALLAKLEKYDGLLVALGAEKLLNNDEDFTGIINNSLTYCDGYGAVFALKRKGVHAAKIPGASLWLSIIEKFCDEKTFYLLGSSPEVVSKTKKNLETRYPKIKIVGYHDGFFSCPKKIKDELKSLRPNVVFVAMGSPKQEFFMSEAYEHHNALYMGLGGSFDLFVGNAKKVPKWWVKIIKWEGLYRVLTDLSNMKRIKRQRILFKFIFSLIQGKI